MEEKVIVRYQRSTDYKDSFSEAGIMTDEEALRFFDHFPFEADCSDLAQLPINSPNPTQLLTLDWHPRYLSIC